MNDAAEEIEAEKHGSRIRKWMYLLRSQKSTLLLVAAIFVLGANLAATIKGITLLELQSRNAEIERKAQLVEGAWTDEHGVRQTLQTPRRSGESDAAWRQRHEEAVAFFHGPQGEE